MFLRKSFVSFSFLFVFLFGIAIATPAEAVDNLEVRIEFDDNEATVWVSYKDNDGDNFDEKFVWTGMNSLEEVYDKIESQTDATSEEAEAVAEVEADESVNRGEAADLIKEVGELVDAADEAYDDMSNAVGFPDDTLYEARMTLAGAKDYHEEAEEGYSIEDYEYAIDNAEDAEDEAEEVFDILNIDKDDYLDMTDAERETAANDKVAEAKSTYYSIVAKKNTAKNKDGDVTESEALLKEAFELYDDALDHLDDNIFSQAKTLATESIEKSNDAADAIPDIEVVEEEDRIELIDNNDDNNEDKIEAEEMIEKADAIIDETDDTIEEAEDTNKADEDEISDAEDKLSQARSKLNKAEDYFDDRDFEEALDDAQWAITYAEAVYGILDMDTPDFSDFMEEDEEESIVDLNDLSEDEKRAELQKQLEALLKTLIELLTLKAAMGA